MLLGVSLVLILCTLSSKITYRIGIPTIMIFIFIGMFLGPDGPLDLQFNDIDLARQISDVALLFIMFYGGFGLKWNETKKTATSSLVLSTLGVILTASIVGLFAHHVFGLSLLEGMVIGAVISPTDAASVFSVLNTSKLNLKNNLSQLLEMESGTNDPTSYTITILFIAIAVGNSINIPLQLFADIAIGLLIGYIVGKLAVYIINKVDLEVDGLYLILIIGVALLSYASAYELGGNGFLAVFLTGIIVGNSKIIHHDSLSKYFDGISWLMQILLFLTLSLLVTPSHLPEYLLDGILLAIFIIFIARPIVVFICLLFSKRTIKEKILISVAGFRGAVSLVFACYVLASNIESAQWIFNVVFIIAFLSLMIQGITFVPLARKFDLVEEEEYDQSLNNFIRDTIHDNSKVIYITKESNVYQKRIMDLDIPNELRFVLLKRNNKVIFPVTGQTIFHEGDIVTIVGSEEHLTLLN